MASSGFVPAADMFRSAEQTNHIVTWVIRAVGTIVMWIGFFLVLRPIAVVGDLVPLIGSVLAAGAGLASFLMTATVAPVVIAIAWFVYRPLVSLAVLAAGALIVVGLRLLARRRGVARGPAPGRVTAPA